MDKVQYTPPMRHEMPTDAAKFLAALREKDRQVHEIAQRDLGSSYFMGRTNGYGAWKKTAGAAT